MPYTSEHDRAAALARMRQKTSGDGPRRMADVAARLRALLFEQQLDALDDPARFLVVRCPRRAGKTYLAIVMALYYLVTRKAARVVVVSRTREIAKRNFWADAISVAQEVGLQVEEHLAELFLRAPETGGIVEFRGCETEADVGKFRGTRNHLVVIDEVQEFGKNHLEVLIEASILPTLLDYSGKLVLVGTPSHILAGPFFEASCQEASEITEVPGRTDGVGVLTSKRRALSRPFVERGDPRWAGVAWRWSLHHWTHEHNTGLVVEDKGDPDYGKPKIWVEGLRMKEVLGWSDDNPRWLREYLGQWAPDDGRLVYAFRGTVRSAGAPDGVLYRPAERTEKNPWGLPEGEKHVWRFVIGVDLGFADPFALQMFAYSATSRVAYQVYEQELAGLAWSKQAEEIHKAVEAAGGWENVDAVWADIDGLGGAIAEDFLDKYGIPLEVAKRRNKLDHVSNANSDLHDGLVLIKENSRLAGEMAVLSWDDTGLREKEEQPNHNCDAFLYGIVHARHAHAIVPSDPLPPLSPAEKGAKEADDFFLKKSQVRDEDAVQADLGLIEESEAWDDWKW